MDWRPYMRELIAAIEASGAQDDIFAQMTNRKRPDGKSEIDVVNRLKRAVNEAKMCLDALGQ